MSLADARQRRNAARTLLANGVDPSEKKKEGKIEQRLGSNFESIARQWLASN